MGSLEETDRASEAVRKGFRITLDYLKAQINSIDYVWREHLTVCILKLDNGYYLVGKSAPVDPANYSKEYGEQLAYENALIQAWPLYAFAHLEKE